VFTCPVLGRPGRHPSAQGSFYTLAMAAPYLVLDAASPLVSVAVGRGAEVLSQRVEEIGRSSARLLAMVDECLREAGVGLAGLAGIAALAGPGSFTGLRIGLATVLGIHQATGLRAAALPTLPVLASLAPEPEFPGIGAVDALRGEWTVQRGSAPPELVGEDALVRLGPCTLVGFGISRLARPGWPGEVRLLEPGPLAPAALPLMDDPALDWDPGRLTAPLYARPPAVTRPRERRPAAAGPDPSPAAP
jgi:tRNA threonylcarbamoyl adenosine modification protein YeaZ